MEQLAFTVLASLGEHVVAVWRSRRIRLILYEIQSLPRKRKLQLVVLLTCLLLSILYVLHSGGNQSTAVNRSELAEDGHALITEEEKEEEKQDELPPKGAAEEEHHSSLTIFFILLVVGECLSL